jgi:peptidoglycan/LPS O-acetylase OafA/YrhL
MKKLENLLWVISVSLIGYGIFGAAENYKPDWGLKTILVCGFVIAIIACSLKLYNSIKKHERQTKA